MKYILGFTLMIASTLVLSDTFVNGYIRQDGTYVAPHYRSAPNNYRYDNYSSQGNVNPYNGNVGTANSYYSPPPNPYNYLPRSYQYQEPRRAR